jgi:RES domain-containing protein
MITAYRITKARYASTAFDGEGARRVGGRWNRRGTPLVYLGEGVAIATLEMLVHLHGPDLLADAYRLIRVLVPEEVALDLPESALRPGWADPASTVVAAPIGSEWVESGASAALRVPSAVVPYEHDVLLNPAHPDMGRLAFGAPEPFLFDARLAQR